MFYNLFYNYKIRGLLKSPFFIFHNFKFSYFKFKGDFYLVKNSFINDAMVCFFISILFLIFRILLDKTYNYKYLAIDYLDYLNFSSNYVYNYKDYFEKEILNNINAISFKTLSLKELKNYNIVDVVSLRELKINPRFWIALLDSGFFRSVSNNQIDKTFIYTNDLDYLNIIYDILVSLFSNKVSKVGNVIQVDLDYDYVVSLEVFPLKEVEEYRSLGKKIIWRVSSYFYELEKLDYIKSGDIVVFNGPFVAGYPFYLKKLKELFINKNLIFGFVEYYTSKSIQKGAIEFAYNLPVNNKIKLFSTYVVKDKSANSILNSIDLAFNERNCRLILFRFSENLNFYDNINILKKSHNNILKLSNNINKNNDFENINGYLAFIKIISLVALILFIIYSFASVSYYYNFLVENGYNLNGSLFFMFNLFLLILFIFSFVFKIEFIFEVLVLFFVSFLIVVFVYREIFLKEFNNNFNIVLFYFYLVLWVIILGVFVQAVLFNENLYLAINKVSGIKLLLILPIFLSIFLVFNYKEIRLFLVKRIRVIDVLIILFILGGIGVYLLRSGNTGFIFPFESELRSILDNILIARPRFKEFLIGNPALLFLLYFVYLKYTNKLKDYEFKLIPFLFLISFITFSDIVDTFLHVHTPILFGLLRTFWALIFGLLIFYFFRFIYNKVIKKI